MGWELLNPVDVELRDMKEDPAFVERAVDWEKQRAVDFQWNSQYARGRAGIHGGCSVLISARPEGLATTFPVSHTNCSSSSERTMTAINMWLSCLMQRTTPAPMSGFLLQ